MNERITPYDPELAKIITKDGQRIVRELAHILEDKISMNERIKKLKDQTLDKHFSYTWSKMDYDDVNKFAEKFAELILQECLVLFENAKVNQEDDVDYGLEEAKNIIKEHFGVERVV